MAKIKELKDSAPKKGVFQKIFNKKSNAKKIIEFCNAKKIQNLIFYTSEKNIGIILENGIRLLGDKNLIKGQEYEVWTYLENDNSIGLEFDNSSRTHFWKWVSDASVDINEIATVGINFNKLNEICKKDWAKEERLNIVYVYENIPVECIEWIMLKKRQNVDKYKSYVEANDLEIDVFYGEKGNVDKVNRTGDENV